MTHDIEKELNAFVDKIKALETDDVRQTAKSVMEDCTARRGEYSDDSLTDDDFKYAREIIAICYDIDRFKKEV